MAAPTATTSSGLTPLCGSFPIKLRAVSTTFGMRVIPPTSTSSFDLAGRQLRLSQTIFDRPNRSLEKVVSELLQFGSGQFLLDVFRTSSRRQ